MKLRRDARIIVMGVFVAMILFTTVLQILAPRLQQSLLTPSSSSYAYGGAQSVPVGTPTGLPFAPSW